MSKSNRRLTTIVVVILLLLALLLLLARCKTTKPETPPLAAVPSTAISEQTPQPSTSAPATSEAPEVLTPATLQAPPQIGAGSVFSIAWTGPNNAGDFITIIRKDKPAGSTGAYTLTRGGSPLSLTAPVEPGEDWELRYVTRSAKVLGRAAISITPAGATLSAPDQVALDTPVSVAWTGPNNEGDYVTIVPRDAPEGRYGTYTVTSKGSPLIVTAPPLAGEAELRYMTGQGAKVLARRPIKIVAPEVTLSAPAEAVAGSTLSVVWTGPANAGDYITIVPKTKPDGQYVNYTTVNNGSPLKLRALIEPGESELRYMTGRGAQVLARRPINLVAAEVSLSAPTSAAINLAITVTWTGPANEGDYITVVKQGTPDGQYGNYTPTTKGSPLTISALKEPAEAELRYVSGQGSKTLARRSITITP